MSGYSNIHDLATPEIDPDQWQTDMAVDAVDFAAIMEMYVDALGGRVRYFREAGVPAEIVKHYEEVARAAGTAFDAAEAGATAVETWISGLELPDFERVA